MVGKTKDINAVEAIGIGLMQVDIGLRNSTDRLSRFLKGDSGAGTPPLLDRMLDAESDLAPAVHVMAYASVAVLAGVLAVRDEWRSWHGPKFRHPKGAYTLTQAEINNPWLYLTEERDNIRNNNGK